MGGGGGGGGRRNFLKKGGAPPRFSSPSPNPTLSSSKTFVFIESLFRVFNMLKDKELFFFLPQ